MTVLQRSELEKSPLADLHAIASELGVEGFRGLRRDDLVAAIVRAQGGDDPPSPRSGEPTDEGADDGGRPTSPSAAAGARARAAWRPLARRRPEAGRRSLGRRGSDAARTTPPTTTTTATTPTASQVGGVLDVLPNGSGFLRSGDGDENSDVYVSAAQIRRCELRGGDDVTGRMRPARRNEKHPSLVRVEQVNGRDAEPPEERPLFADLTAVHPTEKLPVPDALGLGRHRQGLPRGRRRRPRRGRHPAAARAGGHAGRRRRR